MLFWLIGTVLHRRTPNEIVAEAITEEFVDLHIRSRSNPVARLAHQGKQIPPGLLASNRVTFIELIPLNGSGRRRIFEDEKARPPSAGMITGVPNARRIGLFFPPTLDQPEIEVRVNYSCELGDDAVAVHVVVPNPLVLQKQER